MQQSLLKVLQPSESPRTTCSKIGRLQIIGTLDGNLNSAHKLVLDEVTQRKYVVKVLEPNSNEGRDIRFRNSVDIHRILSQDKHSNIVDLVDSLSEVDYQNENGTTNKVAAVVTKYAENGDLFAYLEKYGAVSEEIARTYFHNLIDGLEAIHSKGFVHLNLTLENLFLTKEYSLQISGFSKAAFVREENQILPLNKITNYCSPESISNGLNNHFQDDLFACGVILFNLVTGHSPFSMATNSDPFYKLIKQNNFNAFWKQHERRGTVISNSLKSLLNSMLSSDPSQRLSIAEIKAHTWYFVQVLSAQDLADQHKQRFVSLQKTTFTSKQASLEKSVSSIGNQKNGYHAFNGIKIRQNVQVV